MSTNSAENFAHFYSIVLSDLSLQAQLRELDNKSVFMEKVIELGAENGFVFTGEDVQEAINESYRVWIERWI